MFSFSLVLCALVAAALGFNCPPDGQHFYSHPNFCRKFIECNHGVEKVVECFGDMVFNPTVGFCDFPSNYPCVDTDGPVGVCPPVNGEFVDFLTDAVSCEIFYMCNWGTPIQMKCPDNLHFNPKLNVCDYPHRAGCTVGSSFDQIVKLI